jgi:hypothetical protein
MMDAIADRKDELEDVVYISSLVFHPYKIFTPEYRKPFYLMTGFYDPLTMGQHAEGVSVYVPVQSSNVGYVSKKRQEIDPRRIGILSQTKEIRGRKREVLATIAKATRASRSRSSASRARPS